MDQDQRPMYDADKGAVSEVGAAEYPSSALMTPENMMLPYDYQSFISSDLFRHICLAGGSQLVFSSSSDQMVESEANSSEPAGAAVVGSDVPYDDYVQAPYVDQIPESDGMGMLAILKCNILHHPLFPRLLRAYVNWQKFASGGRGGLSETGFSDEMESWDDIYDISAIAIGSDPELDEFMETYCEILEKHNEDLFNTLTGFTSFISSMEMQLTDLCGALSITSLSDAEEGIIREPEEANQLFLIENPARDGHDDQRSKSNTTGTSDLKMDLLSKYGCDQVSSLKLEFSRRAKNKKKKKGKLPCQARQLLLNWWNSHHCWPYPTDADKVELTRKTGLLPKQVNNWFINQRKRHWRNPSESLRYSWVDNNLSAGSELHFAEQEREAT